MITHIMLTNVISCPCLFNHVLYRTHAKYVLLGKGLLLSVTGCNVGGLPGSYLYDGFVLVGEVPKQEDVTLVAIVAGLPFLEQAHAIEVGVVLRTGDAGASSAENVGRSNMVINAGLRLTLPASSAIAPSPE